MPRRASSTGDGDFGQLRPLHGGRHSLPADLVAHSQRERLLSALATTVAKHGYNEATIAQVAEVARVSRRTFYENFASKEECFIATYEALDFYIANLIAEAMQTQDEWADRVATALIELVHFFASRPHLARFYVVESAAVGEAMASRRETSAARIAAMLAQGRSECPGREPAEGIEEAVVGGIVTLLARRIAAGEAERLDSLAPAVIELAVAPYVGHDEARLVIARHT